MIKWHPEYKLLYEVIQDGQRMWVRALQITDADVLECRPLPQTRKDHPSRTGDCSHKLCMERRQAEERKSEV
jgi:hypothetical protein